jgi:hypothetical protein
VGFLDKGIQLIKLYFKTIMNSFSWGKILVINLVFVFCSCTPPISRIKYTTLEFEKKLNDFGELSWRV